MPLNSLRYVVATVAIAVLALSTAYAVFATLLPLLARLMPLGHTDIIGAPIFLGFNPAIALVAYAAAMAGCMACIALLAHLVLRRWPSVVLPAPARAPASPAGWWWDGSALLYALVAAVGLAIGFDLPPAPLVPALYVLGLGLERFACAWRAEHWLARVLVMVLVAILWRASAQTGWREASVLVALPWMPTSLALALAAAGLACTRWHGQTGLRSFKQSLAAWVLAPLLVFLATGYVANETAITARLTLGADFHVGERLVPLALALKGGWPWRDFMFVHGIWDDFLNVFLGTTFWEHSLRGGYAGYTLLLIPAYWVSMYGLALAVLGGRYGAALAGVMAAYALMPFHLRFPLYALLLACLYWWFRYGRPIHAACFAVLCAVQLFLAPEFVVVGLALGSVLALNAALQRHGLPAWLRTLGVPVMAGAASLIGGLALLWQLGLLEGFLVSLLHFSREHTMTGGRPILAYAVPPAIRFNLIVTMAFIGIAVAGLALKWGRRRLLEAEDWLLLAVAAATALYFCKFLACPDFHHMMQVLSVAVPGLAVGLGQVLHGAARAVGEVSPLRSGPVLGGVLGVLALLPPWPDLPTRIETELLAVHPTGPWARALRDVRTRFRPSHAATDEAGFAPGFAYRIAPARVAALRAYFAPRLSAADTVFDFSNSPLLAHAVLGLSPASRFVNATMAVRAETQALIVGELEAQRPAYVLYSTPLGTWDNIANEVRHHVLAAYINAHYSFDAEVAGHVILRRLGPAEASDPTGAPAALLQCELGLAPIFYAPRTAPSYRQAWVAAAGAAPASGEQALALSPWSGSVPLHLKIDFARGGASGRFPVVISAPGVPGAAIRFMADAGAAAAVAPLGGCYPWAAMLRAGAIMSLPTGVQVQAISLSEEPGEAP